MNRALMLLWQKHNILFSKEKSVTVSLTFCRYSRYVIWLEAAITNNDPKVVANNYLQQVQQLEGITT